MKRAVKIILLSVLVLLLLLFLYLSFRYISWRRSFSPNNENVFCSKEINIDEYNFDSKVENFVFSKEGSEYITMTTEEVIAFLLKNSQVYGVLNLDDLCISPSNGRWNIYLNLKLGSFNIPWIKFDIVKDERETVELFAENISVGDMLLPSVFSEKIMIDMNKGISDAIILVSENNFLGRGLKNIELKEDGIILR